MELNGSYVRRRNDKPRHTYAHVNMVTPLQMIWNSELGQSLVRLFNFPFVPIGHPLALRIVDDTVTDI